VQTQARYTSIQSRTYERPTLVDKEARVQSDTYSFVVRIWHEALDSEGHVTDWRGSVDCVANGQRLHFYDLDRLVQFIQEHVGLEGGRSRVPRNIRADQDPA
jgi:hypothetical protein